MTNLNFTKEITALLVVDPYNDFISEGGKTPIIHASNFRSAWRNGGITLELGTPAKEVSSP